MANLAGIDGCKAGWLCIFEELPSRRLGSKIFPTIDDLAKHANAIDVIAIDIPIGLTNSAPRRCDTEARALLGPLAAQGVGERASPAAPRRFASIPIAIPKS